MDGDDRSGRVVDVARRERVRVMVERQRVEQQRERIVAEQEQRLIEREVRATRRALVQAWQRRGGSEPPAVLDEDFLAVADQAAVADAIVTAAVTAGAADACDLQMLDPRHKTLEIRAHRGLTEEFLTYFAVVDSGGRSACGTALATGEPILVDDVTRSPIFAGCPSLEVMVAAGSRAVQSYPLLDDSGDLLGMLSFHYRHPAPRRGNPELVAWSAARALAQLPAQVPADGNQARGGRCGWNSPSAGCRRRTGSSGASELSGRARARPARTG
jgi:GAF domain